MSTKDIFEGTFERIIPTIDYNSKWENGSGYFNGAAEGDNAPKLIPGELTKTIDPTGRKIIFIGTRLGNMVVFERYVTTPARPPVYCFNTTKDISALDYFPGTRLGEADLNLLFGSWFNLDDNFGLHLERVRELLVSA